MLVKLMTLNDTTQIIKKSANIYPTITSKKNLVRNNKKKNHKDTYKVLFLSRQMNVSETVIQL